VVDPIHVANLRKNVADIDRLLEIHGHEAGKGPGYKHNVEVLHKSAIVLIVACWEAFVEDLASFAFAKMLQHADRPKAFPGKVLALAAKDLRTSKDETAVWQLAGTGWRSVLQEHRKRTLARFVAPFNTPKTAKVDELCETLLGVPKLSSSWHWKGMTVRQACTKLDALVMLRGSIAHRVSASKKVGKGDVQTGTAFVMRLAIASSNGVREFVMKTAKKEPWAEYDFKK